MFWFDFWFPQVKGKIEAKKPGKVTEGGAAEGAGVKGGPTESNVWIQ